MRSLAAWGMTFALLAACAPEAEPHAGNQTAPTAASSAPLTDSGLCAELHGMWDPQERSCAVVSSLPKDVTVTTTIRYPEGLISDPVLGPGLRDYARQFLGERTNPGYLTSNGSAQAGTTALTGHETKTLVFFEDWYYQQMPHPSEALATWTFDLARGKRIQLADLFCPGTDPLAALPPLVRPYLRQAYAAKTDGFAGAIPLEQFEPGEHGYLASDYRAWALDGDDLLLYLPASRGPAGMPPGYLTPRVPLTALRPILRGNCAA